MRFLQGIDYCKDMRKFFLIVVGFTTAFSAPLRGDCDCPSLKKPKEKSYQRPPKKWKIKAQATPVRTQKTAPAKKKSKDSIYEAVGPWFNTEDDASNYWGDDSDSINALNTSLLYWGAALFVAIAVATGLTKANTSPVNTPDIQSSK